MEKAWYRVSGSHSDCETFSVILCIFSLVFQKKGGGLASLLYPPHTILSREQSLFDGSLI